MQAVRCADAWPGTSPAADRTAPWDISSCFFLSSWGSGLFGLGFAGYLAKWVLAKDAGAERMRRISAAIQEGAEAFLRRQNQTILSIAAIFAALLFIGYGQVRRHHEWDPVASPTKLASWIALSFALGALCSVLAGYVGMWVSIRSNVRTATAALTSLNDALRIALRGGAVSGLLVVALSGGAEARAGDHGRILVGAHASHAHVGRDDRGRGAPKIGSRQARNRHSS